MSEPEIRDRYNAYQTVCDRNGDVDILGKGKFGVTIRAVTDDGEEQVAIKVLRKESATSNSGIKRFVREIRVLRHLDHGNLVKYLGADTNDHDEMFLVMELCEGGSLSEFVARHGRLSERTAAKIALQVVRGLKETHSKGFLHRDLKPSNLLLNEHLSTAVELDVALMSNPSLVKVADFGLVGHLTDNGTVKRGKFGGTVLFASPEQFQERNLDVRSDFYSLGMSMWFLVCGENPFRESENQKIDFKAASQRHTDEIPHIESETMRALDLSPAFTQLLHKLLAKNREERLPDAEAVERAINRFLNQTSRNIEPLEEAADPLQDSTVSEAWGKGQVEDFYDINRDISELRKGATTLRAIESDTGEEFMLTLWNGEQDPMDAAERSLGRYLYALRRFSQRQDENSSLVPIKSVRRTESQWCVAEPVIRGFPLSSYFKEDLHGDFDEVIQVLTPIAETIEAMAMAGFNRGTVSAESVFVVPKFEDDFYFVQGQWCDESMSSWPEWKPMFSGISTPPKFDSVRSGSDVSLLSSIDSTNISEFESLLTNTEIFPTINLTETNSLEETTLIDLKGSTLEMSSGSKTELLTTTGLNYVTRDKIDQSGDLFLFRNFCRLVFRLFAGRDAATAASWAPGAYVPTGNLSKASNELLRSHIAGEGEIESATEFLGRILRYERKTSRTKEMVYTTSSPLEETAAPVEETKKSIFAPGLSDFLSLGGLILFMALPVSISLILFKNSGTSNSSPPEIPAIASSPQTADRSGPDDLPSLPLDLDNIPPDDTMQNWQAAHDTSATREQRIQFLANAARGFELKGERERARMTYLELVGVIGQDFPALQSRYLAEADKMSPLGIPQWTFIYENTDSEALREQYQRRTIASLSGTEPEEAFARLMELAEEADKPREKIHFWSRGTSLPNVPREKLRSAYEKMAKAGGFEEKTKLYDFLRANTTFQQDAIAAGKDIYLNSEARFLPERIKVARELWERYHVPEALKWLADNHPEGIAKQKLRWEYYRETEFPEYANAAKILSTHPQLSEKEKARYAWMHFETLPLSERDSNEAKALLTQAIESRINEAVVYRDRSRQIEASRKAAETAKQAAIEAVAAAKRIDIGLKEIVAQKIERDGKLDVQAYEEKMARFAKLLEEVENSGNADRLPGQRSTIFWKRFITWEEATGLKSRHTPYAGRSDITTLIAPDAFNDLSTAATLGNQDAKARLASILAGANPVKPPEKNVEKAAQLAGEVYQSGGIGRTEAKLVLRHLLRGSDDMQVKASAVLRSMKIDSDQIWN